MLSTSNNRVKAIRNRFENLNLENENNERVTRKESVPLVSSGPLNKQKPTLRGNVGRKKPLEQTTITVVNDCEDVTDSNHKRTINNQLNTSNSSESEDDIRQTLNSSSNLLIDNDSSTRTLLRQSSDPTRKLQRSHAFRCDRSQKIGQSPKRHSSCNGRTEMNEPVTLKIGEKPRLSRERLRRLGHLLEDRMRKENFTPLATEEDKGLAPVLNDSSLFKIIPKYENLKTESEALPNCDFPKSLVPDEQVPKHILEQYSKVLKPKKKNSPDSPTELFKQELMTDSGVSSETENGLENEGFEKIGRLKSLRAHFESGSHVASKKTAENNLNLQRRESKDIVTKENLKKTNLEIDSEISSSTETIRRIERKNPNIVLTDTLKKALKQPLPPGPPPKKPPRTFALTGDSAPNSPEFSPRPERKPLNKTTDVNAETVSKTTKKDSKQMLEKLERALKKHNDSKTITSRRKHNIYDIAETDMTDPEPIDEDVPKKSPNRKEIHYLCTEILDIAQRSLLPNSNSETAASIANCFNSLNCSIAPTRSSTSIAYAKLNSSGTSSRSSLSNICCACNGESVENIDDIPENRNKFSTFFSGKSDDSPCKQCGHNLHKEEMFQCHLNCKCKDTIEPKSNFFVTNDPEHIYSEPYHHQNSDRERQSGGGSGEKSIVGCDVSPSDEVGPVGEGNWGSCDRISGVVNGCLGRSFEDQHHGEIEEKIYDVPCDPSRSPSPAARASSPRRARVASLRRGFEPESRLELSRSSEELSATPAGGAERKFRTVGAGRRLGAARRRGGSGRRQLDVDRENLNKLMEEINATVSAHCGGGGGVSRFPVDADTSSEDSVKLSRSLTDKRKNYVRRVSSRVAYLEPQARQSVRFRHQTSVCSYRSDDHERSTYATFRSWKSFKNSQNLSKSSASLKIPEANGRDSTDSKANLTDSRAKLTDSRSNLTDSRLNPTDSRPNLTDSKANLTDSRGNLLRGFSESADVDETLGESTIDDTAGCLDIDRPPEAREKGLIDFCLLVGLNHMTGQAYVKSVFPKNARVPPHIENLVFPETLSTESEAGSRPEYDLEAANTQRYSLVLTNERGERSFGYCRRVLPEGAGFCLPLAYCLISRFREPGLYYKVLEELESHHGSSDVVMDSILQQLFEKDFPSPGETITLTQLRSPRKRLDELRKNSLYRNSINLGDILKCKTLPDPKKGPRIDHGLEIPEYYDLENNNRPVLSLPPCDMEVTVIKRPIEPRMDEDNLSVLFDSMSVNLLIKIFGSLLLERKVVLISDKLSQLSSCIEALQSILYPLVWQQPLVSALPAELRRDMLEAPLPLLAGMLRGGGERDAWERRLRSVRPEEGMLVDLSPKSGARVIFEQGDEGSIIPGACAKSLRASLQLESSRNLVGSEREVEKARNVLISEAFLRFFVDVMAEFWQHFATRPDSGGEEEVVFEKERFIRSGPSKAIQYFLEWFTETAMFNHFIENMRMCFPHRRGSVDFAAVPGLVDTPLPGYYEVFEERVTRRHLAGGGEQREPCRNVKSAVNKRVKLLKNKLRELVN